MSTLARRDPPLTREGGRRSATPAGPPPEAASAPPARDPPRAAPPDAGHSPLSQLLARAVATRTPPDAVLMRAEGDGTAVLEPGQERVSSEEIAQLMTTYRLADQTVLTALLEAADYDVAGLQRLGRSLTAKGAGVALARRLLRRASAKRAEQLVAATRFPQRLPQLLYYVPNAELLRTLLLFEDGQDPTWLVRVCSPVPVGEQHMLPTLLERLPRPAAPALLGLERPSVLFGLLALVDDPAPLVTVLPLVPDRALLRRCLTLEPRGALLASLCSRMSVDRDDLPRLLGLVPDRGVLLRLLTAEGDGRRLVALLELAGDPVILERLLRDIRNRDRLQSALAAVSAELGPGGDAAAAVAVLVQAKLLPVVNDQARLKRVLAIIRTAQGAGADADTMGEALTEAEEFDFHWEFGIAALERARAVTEALVDAERQRLEGLDATAIEQAIVDQAETAKETKLTNKERHRLERFSQTGEDVRKKLRKGQEELAQDEIERIRAKSANALEQYRAGAAALAGGARKQEYVAYFKAVAYDPDALAALSATGEDTGAAQRLLGALGVLPALRASALDKTLGVDALERLTALPDPPRSALIGGLDAATLGRFAASDDRRDLLGALGQSHVPPTKIKACGAILPTLEPHIAAGQHAAFAVLLNAYTADEVATLLTLAPGALRASFVAGLHPHAQNFPALKGCLSFAKRVKWTQADLNAAILPLPLGRTLQQLREAIRDSLNNAFAGENFNDPAVFSRWMKLIALLLDEQLCTITCGQTYALPQLPGKAFTTETLCTVNPLGDTFVLHTHPWITLTSDKSSRYHIKPWSGDATTPHMYSEHGSHTPRMPKTVQDKLPSLTAIKRLFPVQ